MPREETFSQFKTAHKEAMTVPTCARAADTRAWFLKGEG